MISRTVLTLAGYLSLAQFLCLQLITMPMPGFGQSDTDRIRLVVGLIVNLIAAVCAFVVGVSVLSLLTKTFVVSVVRVGLVGVLSALAIYQIAPIVFPTAYHPIAVSIGLLMASIVTAIILVIICWIFASRAQ
jgi:hypothetical protein